MPTVDPEFRDLIPPLTPEERAGLEASIRAEGCRDPLVVWSGHDVILDGHNRFDICTAHGIGFDTKGLTLADSDEAKAWIIRNQFARRNLNLYQRAELVLRLEPLIAAEAEARMMAGKKLNPMQNSAQGPVREKLARLAGVSHDTIDKAKLIQEKAPEQIKEQLRRGEASISAEYLRLRNPVNRLSSDSMEWYTPAQYVEAARRVLGEIDLDPASCNEANKTIRAGRYFAEKDDGLAHDWPGRVWLNPPYCGLQGPFVQKLIAEYEAGRTRAAVILVNANSTDAGWFAPLFDFPLCFVRGRMNFHSPSTDKSSPTHGSVFAYLGPDEDRFIAEFAALGPVVKRVDHAA